MTTYYRVSDAALRDLTNEQFAALAPSKLADLRIYVIDAKPASSATQLVIDAGVVVGPVEAHRTWALVNKSAAQLEEEAARDRDVADLAQLRLVYAALLAGTGTAGERITRAEKAVAYLLRKYGADKVGPA